MLCNEEAVLCLILKDDPPLPPPLRTPHPPPSSLLGVVTNAQINFMNVLKPEKQTGENVKVKSRDTIVWKVCVLPLTNEAQCY